MKIIGPENFQPLQPGRTPGTKESVNTTDFDNMLREAQDAPNSSGGVQRSALLSEPRAVRNIGQQVLQPESLMEKTYRAIDLLENYSKALSDPRKTLRDIEPQLTAFVSETESLYDAYLETDHDDPGLKSIMEDLLRTARLEGIRFQRGDYLDTE